VEVVFEKHARRLTTDNICNAWKNWNHGRYWYSNWRSSMFD